MTQLIEGPQIEFKRDWTDGAKRSAVAFANTSGGTIYLGVEDDGTVRGLADIDETQRRATQAISDDIRPDLMSFASVEPETMQGMTVVAAHIQRGTNRPYYLADKGIRPAGVYIRSGAASIPASEAAIVDMIRQTAGDSFEDAVCLAQRLTFTAAEATFTEAGMAFTQASRRTLGLISPDGVYTNLAWLLSDQCTASIKAAVFADDDKETFLNRQEFNGSLLTQFNQVNEFIARHNPVCSSTGTNLRRIDDYGYSPLVLREALLNLIVHRDYGLSGPALISIFDDHMEFLNLGGLPATFTREDMFNGISSQRNPKLANVFYRLRLVEAYGTGIRRILGDYREEQRQPRFNITDHAFRLNLPKHEVRTANAPDDGQTSDTAASRIRQTDLSPAERRRQTILDHVSQYGSISRKEAQALTGASQASVFNDIRDLVRQNRLIRIGSGPATRYRFPVTDAR